QRLGDRRALSPRLQLLRLQATALAGRLRRVAQQTADWLYARYWWSIVGLVGVAVWPLVTALPTPRWRWRLMHPVVRLRLTVLGHRLTVTAESPLLSRDVVYVANHTSYVDHLALAAALPGDLAFAAYKELADAPIQGPFARRLGVFFVERFEPQGAAAEV